MRSPPAPPFRSRDLTAWVFLGLALGWASFIHSRSYSSNDASRLATLEALVQRGTWAIEASPFATVDKIKVGDHFYSDKPPLLSWLGAGVYGLLHHGLGLTLQAQGCAPEQTPTYCRAFFEAGQADWAYFVLTFLFVSLPGALMLTLLYRLARHNHWPNGFSLMFVGVLGFGTALFPFSTVLSNHVPAAAAVVGALGALIHSPGRGRLALAGTGLSLAMMLDPLAGLFWALSLVYVIWQYRSRTLWFLIGSAPWLALTAALNYQIVGNPLLPQMYAPGYAYAGTSLSPVATGTQQATDVFRYAFNLLVGERGFLAFYPVVLWLGWAAVRSLRADDRRIQPVAGITVGASALFILYFIFFTDSYGGFSYSPRWLLILVPALALFWVLRPPPVYSVGQWIGLGGLAALSVVSGYRGALNPWTPALPLVRLAYITSQAPTALAISGYNSVDEVALNPRALLGTNAVLARSFDARRGLVIPPGPTWWFINASTPLAPELAGALALPNASSVALQADLTPTLQPWLVSLTTDARQSVDLVPADESATTAVRLPQTFGEELTLLGYEWQAKDGQGFLLTAWRVEHKPPPRTYRRVFVHLTNLGGQTTRQNDDFAADYPSLEVGDVLIQVQPLDLLALPAGGYWLQLGIYDPDSGQRLSLPDGADRLLLLYLDN